MFTQKLDSESAVHVALSIEKDLRFKSIGRFMKTKSICHSNFLNALVAVIEFLAQEKEFRRYAKSLAILFASPGFLLWHPANLQAQVNRLAITEKIQRREKRKMRISANAIKAQRTESIALN